MRTIITRIVSEVVYATALTFAALMPPPKARPPLFW